MKEENISGIFSQLFLKKEYDNPTKWLIFTISSKAFPFTKFFFQNGF